AAGSGARRVMDVPDDPSRRMAAGSALLVVRPAIVDAALLRAVAGRQVIGSVRTGPRVTPLALIEALARHVDIGRIRAFLLVDHAPGVLAGELPARLDRLARLGRRLLCHCASPFEEQNGMAPASVRRL